nr:immunoglobulin heavy chain junction region [Mus musculus]
CARTHYYASSYGYFDVW